METDPTPLIVPSSWTEVLDPEQFFVRPASLHVDVGSGKGRFILARAASHPDVNFLGIERLLLRIRKTAKKASRAGLTNVRLLRIEASYAIQFLLPPSSVSTFYIFFPDPWPKRRHHKRRLFKPEFLNSLCRTLEPEGTVHVATDHGGYMDEIEALFADDTRFASTPPFIPSAEEKTDFELEFEDGGSEIRRASWRREASLSV